MKRVIHNMEVGHRQIEGIASDSAKLHQEGGKHRDSLYAFDIKEEALLHAS
jgi:hypothetical protein